MSRAISRIAPGWWDYTTLDPETFDDAARLTAEDLAACNEVWKALHPPPTMFYARGYGIDFG